MDNIFIKVVVKFLIVVIFLLGGFYFAFNYFINKPLIIFVCSGNTGRSPMAAHLVKNSTVFSTRYQITSRGVSIRGSEIKPETKAIAVMKEKGIDMHLHRAKQLADNDVKQAKLVLTMTKSQKEKVQQSIAPTANNVYMLSECADGTQVDIPDAYNQTLPFYREVRDAIEYYIKKIEARDGRCYSSR